MISQALVSVTLLDPSLLSCSDSEVLKDDVRTIRYRCSSWSNKEGSASHVVEFCVTGRTVDTIGGCKV